MWFHSCEVTSRAFDLVLNWTIYLWGDLLERPHLVKAALNVLYLLNKLYNLAQFTCTLLFQTKTLLLQFTHTHKLLYNIISFTQFFCWLKQIKRKIKPIEVVGIANLCPETTAVNLHSLSTHAVKVIGLVPTPYWMLTGRDCMIHGVDSKRTQRSSDEMVGHKEEFHLYAPHQPPPPRFWPSALHFQPQSISLTRKYWLVCNYEVMLPTAVCHSKYQHLPLFIHCYSSTRNRL